MRQEVTHPYDIINAWQKYRPSIEKTLAKMGGMFTQEDVLSRILTGQMHFWERDGTFAITEFEIYPRKKFLNVFLTGGNLAGVKALEEDLAKVAKQSGCNKMVAFVRGGYAKKRDLFPGWELVKYPYRVERDV